MVNSIIISNIKLKRLKVSKYNEKESTNIFEVKEVFSQGMAQKTSHPAWCSFLSIVEWISQNNPKYVTLMSSGFEKRQ